MKSVKYIRKATIEDSAGFSQLVSACGGQPLLRSIFGQYNYPSLIEFSYLTLVAASDKGTIAFASFNDGGLASQETESFDEYLDYLREILPVKV